MKSNRPEFLNQNAFLPEREKVRARYEEMFCDKIIRDLKPEPKTNHFEIAILIAGTLISVLSIALTFMS